MRWKAIVPSIVVAIMSVGTVVPAHAGSVLPYRSHPYGASYAEWLRREGQWFLGDSSNPLIAGLDGDCGMVSGGVFYMVAPIVAGGEFSCDVPAGTPIVLSHAGGFATEGLDGTTDEELIAAADAGFTVVEDSLTLDGASLPLQIVDTGPYDVNSEPGGFYDTVVGVGTGSIRTVVRGNLVVLHPLAPGVHELEAEVRFAKGDVFSATYEIRVG